MEHSNGLSNGYARNERRLIAHQRNSNFSPPSFRQQVWRYFIPILLMLPQWIFLKESSGSDQNAQPFKKYLDQIWLRSAFFLLGWNSFLSQMGKHFSNFKILLERLFGTKLFGWKIRGVCRNTTASTNFVLTFETGSTKYSNTQWEWKEHKICPTCKKQH